jgi:hypothetical protein
VHELRPALVASSFKVGSKCYLAVQRRVNGLMELAVSIRHTFTENVEGVRFKHLAGALPGFEHRPIDPRVLQAVVQVRKVRGIARGNLHVVLAVGERSEGNVSNLVVDVHKYFFADAARGAGLESTLIPLVADESVVRSLVPKCDRRAVVDDVTISTRGAAADLDTDLPVASDRTSVRREAVLHVPERGDCALSAIRYVIRLGGRQDVHGAPIRARRACDNRA